MAGRVANGPGRLATGSWIVYDLANTIFSFAIVSSYYALWVKDQFPEEQANLGSAVFAAANFVAMGIVFIGAPALGALSDRARRRMPFLVASTVLCVAFTFPLGFLDWRVSLVVFALANVGFQAGLIFYDALLPVVSTPETRGRVGGLGVGVGYLGSLAGLGLGASIDAAGYGPELTFASVAAAFLLFALPCFAFVREPLRRAARLRARDVAAATRSSFRGLAGVLRGGEHADIRRFLVGRVLYADAANTMIIFMAIYATTEAGFTNQSVQGVLLAGILGAAGAAYAWGLLVDRAGPKHALDVVLLMWMAGLLVVVLIPVLGLPPGVFYAVAFWLGAALGGTWAADRPLLLALAPADRVGEYFGYYAMVGRFAALLGPGLWFLIVHPGLLDLGQPVAVATLLAFMVGSFLILRRLPDPVRPGPTPFAPYLPWRRADGTRAPLAFPWWTRCPATLVYALVTTSLFLAFALLYGYDSTRAPEALVRLFVYRIPELFAAPALTGLHFVTGVWVNHHPVQLLYVLLLLGIFGAWVEVREGTRRAVALFYGTSIAAGVFAGVLLGAVRLAFDTPWLDRAWDHSWTGGSAGAFGLMGAYAARARRPWLLLSFFLLWEVNVEAWHLRSYTPAFHLPALALGFLWARFRWPSGSQGDQGSGAPRAAEHAPPMET